MQAVEADGRGALEQASELYFKLLECLTRCHALETAPACQAAIMARFKVGRTGLGFQMMGGQVYRPVELQSVHTVCCICSSSIWLLRSSLA